jgi:hypothetical protein
LTLLSAHDFFKPQPIKDATVFFLRGVTHDWPDTYVKIILKELRAAAQPFTKLILSDYLVLYASSSGNLFSDIPGADVPSPPYPLLRNTGDANNRTVVADLQVCVFSCTV